MSLHDLVKIHKETVLFGESGFSVDCILKPPGGSADYVSSADTRCRSADYAGDKYSLKGLTNYTGITIDESGYGNFGDTFELTINLDELKEQTDKIPVKGWTVDVYFPLIDKWGNFKIENAPLDRTLGMALLRCSASTSEGLGKKVYRNNNGGL